MSTEPERPARAQDDVLTLQAIDDSLQALIRALKAIVKWKQRVFWFAVVAVIAGATAIFLSWWTNHTADEHIHANQVSACQTVGNDLRAKTNMALHDFIAIATEGQPQTPAQRLIISKLYARWDADFKPVDCAALYGP